MSPFLGTLRELREALEAGTASSTELVDASLARAEALADTVHAFIGLRPEAARAEAERADARRRRGERRDS